MSSRGNRAYTEVPSRLQPPPLGPKPSSPGQRKRAKPLPHHPAGSGGSSSYSWSTDDEDYSPPIPPKPPSCVPSVAGGAARDTGPFTLPELVSKFGRSLPLCVSVENGYQTDDERESIGMGEMYNLHLVKHAKVVELRDPNGMTYNFPLSSSVQFAPIFSEGDERESCLEHVFERVADVVGHKPLPRLLRATKTFTKDNKTLVEKNEVLIVQRIATNASLGATLMRKKSLRVFSTLHQVEKVLPSDCEGGFTDDSYATRLYISDIVSQFSDQFPLRVRVHITEMEVEDGSEFPYHLTSEVCELTEIKTETSLVASTYQQPAAGQLSPSSRPGSDDEDDDSKYIEIPINLGIAVNIFQPEQDDKESELFQRTKNLLLDFSTAKIRTISRSSLDVGGVTRKGYEREGVEIEESDRVYEVIGEQSRSLYRPYIAKIMQDPTYAEVDTSYQRPPPARPAPDQKNEALPPPLSPKPPSRKTPVRYTTSSPSDRPRVPSPLLEGEVGGRKKIEMGRKLSADVAAEAVMSKEQLYQPLVKPRGSASQSAAIPTYESLVPTPRPGRGSVTTGKKSQEAMMNSLLTAAGEAEDIGTLVRNLIGRIESLEQQVAVLSDKVERLSR